MRAAFEGVETVFLIPAGESADRVEQHKTAVDAAVAAGVARIVYLSFFNAAPDATFTLARDHWATEEHIRATGVTWTFLRMNLYMDFIPDMAVDGVIRGPAGDGRVSRDPARRRRGRRGRGAARAAQTGETFDLTGPSAFSLAEAAELLGVDVRRRDRRGGVRLTRVLRRARLGGRRLGLLLPGDPRRRPSTHHVRRRARADRPRTDLLAGVSATASGGVAGLRAGAGLRGLYLAVLGRRVGHELVEQALRGRRDLLDRVLERVRRWPATASWSR